MPYNNLLLLCFGEKYVMTIALLGLKVRGQNPVGWTLGEDSSRLQQQMWGSVAGNARRGL